MVGSPEPMLVRELVHLGVSDPFRVVRQVSFRMRVGQLSPVVNHAHVRREYVSSSALAQNRTMDAKRKLDAACGAVTDETLPAQMSQIHVSAVGTVPVKRTDVDGAEFVELGARCGHESTGYQKWIERVTVCQMRLGLDSVTPVTCPQNNFLSVSNCQALIYASGAPSPWTMSQF